MTGSLFADLAALRLSLWKKILLFALFSRAVWSAQAAGIGDSNSGIPSKKEKPNYTLNAATSGTAVIEKIERKPIRDIKKIGGGVYLLGPDGLYGLWINYYLQPKIGIEAGGSYIPTPGDGLVSGGKSAVGFHSV